MEQKPARQEERLAVAKATTHKASPIPHRAKFLRKFNLGGKKKGPGPTPTTQGGGQREGERDLSQEREEERREEVMEAEEEREDVTVNGELSTDDSTQQPVKEMKVRTGHTYMHTQSTKIHIHMHMYICMRNC